MKRRRDILRNLLDLMLAMPAEAQILGAGVVLLVLELTGIGWLR